MFGSDLLITVEQGVAGVTVTGVFQVGQVLTANPGSYTAISYVWQHADDNAGANTVVVGSTGSTYTLAAGDSGKYIRAGVEHA